MDGRGEEKLGVDIGTKETSVMTRWGIRDVGKTVAREGGFRRSGEKYINNQIRREEIMREKGKEMDGRVGLKIRAWGMGMADSCGMRR